MPPRQPRRLQTFSYVGYQRYFLTFCTIRRRRAFEDAAIVETLLEQIRHTAAAEAFAIFAYCFMPDHLHLLVEGTHETSDLRRFARFAKQRTAFAFRRLRGGRLWQRGYYERVLRSDEATPDVIRYILANPIRAALATTLGEYPFAGSEVFTVADLVDDLARTRPT